MVESISFKKITFLEQLIFVVQAVNATTYFSTNVMFMLKLKKVHNQPSKTLNFQNEDSDSERLLLIVHQKQLLLLVSSTRHKQETTTGTSQHFTNTQAQK